MTWSVEHQRSYFPLVVKGAVPCRACFPILLSIRTCDFPADGLPTVFWTWLRRLRVTDGAHQLVQALVVEPGRRPALHLAMAQVTAPLLYEEAVEPPGDVEVNGDELGRGIAGAEVVGPSPEEQVQTLDDVNQLKGAKKWCAARIRAVGSERING